MDTNIQDNKDKVLSCRGCCSLKGAMSAEGANSCMHTCAMLNSLDAYNDIPASPYDTPFPFAEVRFKNTSKDFYLLPADESLKIGDIVAVEAAPGHNIGIVSLLGEAAKKQMQKKKANYSDIASAKKIYRKAKLYDINKWIKSIEREDKTMFQSRKLVNDLGLNMKVNDVEYQGDGVKATFYYTAEERVDFRQLIKVLADYFNVRIEMRQIGVRQEAARVGGIGSCGRELCCSSWMSNFKSVSTQTARKQQLSLNPQKLAGQCGKLKCCLNFEQDAYEEALKQFPDSSIRLKTKKGEGIFHKLDVFKRLMWYSYVEAPCVMFELPLKKVKYILSLNNKGKMPADLESFVEEKEEHKTEDILDKNIKKWRKEQGE